METIVVQIIAEVKISKVPKGQTVVGEWHLKTLWTNVVKHMTVAAVQQALAA